MEDATRIVEFLRVGGLVTAAVLLVGTWFAARFVTGALERLGARFTEHRLLMHQAATFARFILYIGGTVAALLASFRFSNEMLLTMGGTLAVTVGFALKDLAASVVAGLIILVDRPFQVGDRVSFGGYYGEITAVGLRSVRLTTLDDNLVTIPNNKFLTDAVSSGNAGALDMLVQMDFYIGAEQDVSLAKQLVSDALTSNRYAYLEKPWSVLVNQVIEQGYFAVRLRAKVYVLDVLYEKALETDVNERVLAAFRAAGIAGPERYGVERRTRRRPRYGGRPRPARGADATPDA